MIVVLQFATEFAFAQEGDFRKTMEAFFQGEISPEEAAERLGDNTEGLGIALGGLFVLAQHKYPGFYLNVLNDVVSVTRRPKYKWTYFRDRLIKR